MAVKLNYGKDGPAEQRRLGELILYIARKCAADTFFGSVKLNKILWRADFDSYLELGKPITGVSYVRRAHGPTPRKLVDVRDFLIRTKRAEIKSVQLGDGRRQDRVISRSDPDMTLFTEEQIRLVDRDILEAWGKTAEDVSEESHGLAWQVAGEDGKGIPYEAAFLSDEPPTDRDARLAKKRATENGWAHLL